MSRPSRAGYGSVRSENSPRQRVTTRPVDDDEDFIEEEEDSISSPRYPNRGPAPSSQDGGQRPPAQTPPLQAIAPMIATFMGTSQTNYRSMAEVVWDDEARLREAFEMQFEENARRSLLKGERERAIRYVQLAQFVNWKYNMPRRNIEEMAMTNNSPITDNFREAVIERFARIAHSVRDSATGSRTAQQTPAPRATTNTTSEPGRRHTGQPAAGRGSAPPVGDKEMSKAQHQQLLRDRVPPVSRHAPQFSERRLQDPTVMTSSRQKLPLNTSTNRPSEPRNLRPANRYPEDGTTSPFDAQDSRPMDQYPEDHVDASHEQTDDDDSLEDDNYPKRPTRNRDDVPDPDDYEVENRIRSSISTSKPVFKPKVQAAYGNSKLPNATISPRTTTKSPTINTSPLDYNEEPAVDEAEEEHRDGEEPLPRASRLNRPTAGRLGTLPPDNGNYPYVQRERNYDTTREKPRTNASSSLPYRPAAPNRRPSPPQKTLSDPADPRPPLKAERTGSTGAYNEDRHARRPNNTDRPPPRGTLKMK